MIRAGRQGFTLIELLVVVGVIAILAAIAAPVLMEAKKTAVISGCRSNLRQIHQAFSLYIADHNGCYPNTDDQYLWAGANWRETMRRYVGISKVKNAQGNRNMILSCPADPIPVGIYSGTSYAYSASFYMTPEQINMIAEPDYLRFSKLTKDTPRLPCSTVKTGAVKWPAKKALVTEYFTFHSAKRVGWYDSSDTGNDPWSGERNYLFADGHVLFLAAAAIRPADSPVVNRIRILPDINLTRDGVLGCDID